MSKFKTTNIEVKAGFTSIIVLMFIFGAFSLYQLRNITLSLTDSIAINSKKIVHVVLMRDAIRQRQVIMAEMLSTEDIFKREEFRNTFYSLAGIFREERDKLFKLPINHSEQVLLDNILAHILITQEVNRVAVNILLEDYKAKKGRELILQAEITQKEIYSLLGDLINLQNENTQKFAKTSRDKYATTLSLSILLGLIIALMSWLIAKFMGRMITQKNEELVAKNKQLEEVTTEALAATRTKSEFLAIMSHEIRTPLASIIGFAEALSEQSTTQIEDRKSITEAIIKNGKHLLNIINDILDISKIEANKMQFEESNFSPVELILDVTELIKTQFSDKGIYFDIEYEFPLPGIIYNDALRLKQIILNLCSNALKFTKVGKVSIKLSCNVKKEKIYFTVKDSGIGLTKGQIEKIFGAFTQADSSTTREYGGTGLGLSLSKQFAEKMGGTITVKSMEDIGSQFCLSINTGRIDSDKLLLDESALHENKENVSSDYDYSRKVNGTILIVEDNHDIQQLLSIVLSPLNAELTFAENGKEAIDRTRIKKFDLIFMDMQMPVMGGIDATIKLREHGNDTPIIALTANAMKSDRDVCIAAGCNGFLTKPFNKEKIFQEIYKYLEIRDDDAGDAGKERIVSEIATKENTKMFALVSKFVKGLSVRMDVFDIFCKQKDWDSLANEAHKLKGVGTSMGYPILTDIAKEIESQAEKKNETEVTEKLLSMREIIDRITRGLYDSANENKE